MVSSRLSSLGWGHSFPFWMMHSGLPGWKEPEKGWAEILVSMLYHAAHMAAAWTESGSGVTEEGGTEGGSTEGEVRAGSTGLSPYMQTASGPCGRWCAGQRTRACWSLCLCSTVCLWFPQKSFLLSSFLMAQPQPLLFCQFPFLKMLQGDWIWIW